MNSAHVNIEQIQAIIHEIENNEFHCRIKQDLMIDDVEYRVHQLAYADYEPEVLARSYVVPQRIQSIYFYYDSICKVVNRNFYRITRDNVIQEIARIAVMFLFAHELKHVQQFKHGLTIDQYREVSYPNSPYEYEANQFAITLICSEGEFQCEIINILCNPRYQMTGNEHIRVMNVYDAQYRYPI